MLPAPQDTKAAGAPEWMVTFADLMSLLLTFFVLLLSFSNTEIIKFKTMAGSVRNALGLKSEFALADVPTGDKLLPFDEPQQGEGEVPDPAEEETVRELEAIMSEAQLEDHATVKVTEHGVLLRISGDLLFDSGSAEINRRALTLLNTLAAFVMRDDRLVDVEGHTDNLPISTAVYPSNWELSAARAGRAVRYLVEKGSPPERIRAIGRAHTKPVAPNNTGQGRAANRRVEFLFVNPRPNLAGPDMEETGGAPQSETGGEQNG